MINIKKSLWALMPSILLLWCIPASAEYCTVKSERETVTCIFKVERIENNSQLVISYTRQGWSMLIAVFVKDFAIIEGPATVELKNGDQYKIEHIKTQRDMTPEGRLMEAAIYTVSEDLLHELGNAKGKVRFYLQGEAIRKSIEVEVAASMFDDLDAYITETKTRLAPIFENP